jgi:hypothetical protein
MAPTSTDARQPRARRRRLQSHRSRCRRFVVSCWRSTSGVVAAATAVAVNAAMTTAAVGAVASS